MKTILIASLLSLLLSGNSIYDFKVPGLDGKEIDFSAFKGKKVLIVNTASKCGNTPQYADLQRLYDKYKNKLVVVGFPANNFGGQEPGENADIEEFCKKNYGVTFPMAHKVSVKGDDIDPVFKWLVTQSRELAKKVPAGSTKELAYRDFLRDPVGWNFTKFLIDENGNLAAVFHNKVNPMSEEITKYLSAP